MDDEVTASIVQPTYSELMRNRTTVKYSLRDRDIYFSCPETDYMKDPSFGDRLYDELIKIQNLEVY